jgi:hypothetical protein
LDTYMFPLDDAKATPEGVRPIVIVPTTVLFDVLITETVPAALLATYMFPLDDAKAIPVGVMPTEIVGVAASATMFKLITVNRISAANENKNNVRDFFSAIISLSFSLSIRD